MAYFCYIMECSDGTFYTGWSTDPQRRERQHNAGRGARYTRDRRPVRLVYVEEQPDKPSALRRELKIKRLPREKKIKLITDSAQEQSLIGKQGQVPEREDVHPLRALALGEDGGLGGHFRAGFIHDHAHPLQRGAGADHVVHDDDFLTLDRRAVLLVEDQRLRFARW